MLTAFLLHHQTWSDNIHITNKGTEFDRENEINFSKAF